jgi:hypothetical protein
MALRVVSNARAEARAVARSGADGRVGGGGVPSQQWYEATATRVRSRTAGYYREALDEVLLPRFGSWRIAAVDADAIARLTRDLERVGLNAIDAARKVRPLGYSSIDNYLKPLRGVLALAVRRRLVSNPFDQLTADDRQRRT